MLSLSEFNPQEYEVMVTISDPQIRKKIISSLPLCTKFFSFIHPTALIMDNNVMVGKGSFIGAYSILTTNINLGAHSILNRGVQIGHDTITGPFLSMMPGSVISGNVRLGECVYLGTNSSVKEKMKIRRTKRRKPQQQAGKKRRGKTNKNLKGNNKKTGKRQNNYRIFNNICKRIRRCSV